MVEDRIMAEKKFGLQWWAVRAVVSTLFMFLLAIFLQVCLRTVCVGLLKKNPLMHSVATSCMR